MLFSVFTAISVNHQVMAADRQDGLISSRNTRALNNSPGNNLNDSILEVVLN